MLFLGLSTWNKNCLKSLMSVFYLFICTYELRLYYFVKTVVSIKKRHGCWQMKGLWAWILKWQIFRTEIYQRMMSFSIWGFLNLAFLSKTLLSLNTAVLTVPSDLNHNLHHANITYIFTFMIYEILNTLKQGEM